MTEVKENQGYEVEPMDVIEYKKYPLSELPGWARYVGISLEELERNGKDIYPLCKKTGRELLHKKFPSPLSCIPGLLPKGLVVLAGKPHSGKSHLALQLALSIATGQPFLDYFPTDKGGVAYVSLEDGEQELQKRLIELGAKNPNRFRYATSFEPGVPWEDFILRSFLVAKGVITPLKLFVVDTIDRAFLCEMVDYSKYRSLHRWFIESDELAKGLEMTILLIHHVEDKGEEGPLDRIFRSEGKMLMLLEGERLVVFPGEEEEQRLVLEREGVRWKYVDKC